MPFEKVLLQISYLIIITALMVKDILWLRSILMVSQTFMITYSIYVGNYTITAYNSIFFTINCIQVIRLLLERRPISLPEDLKEIYHQVFSVMGMREFLVFWNRGLLKEVDGDFLCRQGEVPHELMLIFQGEVKVIRNDKELVTLDKGSFVAEMSFMSGEPASADVKAVGKVKYIAWDRDKLDSLKQQNADLMIKIQVILGKDLTAKLKARSS